MAPRKNKKEESGSSSDSGPEDRGPEKKKPKTSTSNAEEEDSWELDKRRFIKVREFKGKVMVDIREYYEKDGEIRPGKKGISLSLAQWKKLTEVIDDVQEAISKR